MAAIKRTVPTKKKVVSKPPRKPTPKPKATPTALDELRAHDKNRRKIFRGK